MPKHHNLPKLLYKTTEAAEMLSIGRTRIYELISSGDLPSVKVGNSRLISADALAEYAANLTESPVASRS